MLLAISLFNRHGIQGVPIDLIATELQISPGNLTYHFKRKDDLIRATLEVAKEKLAIALARPVKVASPRDGAEYLIRVFRTFWDFRFFLNSLAFLLTDDRAMRNEYSKFRDWVIDTMESDIGYLAERGHFQPADPPNNFRLLAENIWGHLLNWLRLQQIESPSAPTPKDKAVYDCALHLWSLCHHWMNPTFSDALLNAFQDLLIPIKIEPAPIKRSPKRKFKAH